MSESDARKMNKLLKKKKYGGEVIGSFSHTFRWPIWFDLKDTYNFVMSPKFNICGSDWSIKLYPIGINEIGDFISIYLVCDTEENDVFASYSFALLDADGNEAYSWKDPEKILKFSKDGNGDNEWGNDEFYDLEALNEEGNEITSVGRLTIKVTIEVFGRDDLNKETLSAAVQNANETKELMKIADEEIHEVVKKLPALRDSVAQKKQEDGIVTTRAPPPVVEKKNNMFL